MKYLTKIVCSICNSEGLLQVIGKHYFRIRHYDGADQISHKPKFHYHVIPEEYVKGQLDLTKQNLPLKTKSDFKGSLTKLDQASSILDLDNLKRSIDAKLEPSAGFGPATITLPR